ncbi:MAG: hypothetical protein KBA03_05380 [Anaerolineaceae bacterium]|nr:hypothetical protein [Anaerolineaceae bacterium]
MISYLIGFAGFLVTGMLQLSVFSQIKILSGSADILLLYLIVWCMYDRSKQLWLMVFVMAGLVSSISALPAAILMVVYFFVFGVTRLFQKRLTQTPLLGVIVITFVASLLQIVLNLAYLFISGVEFNLNTALFEVALPSLILNMFLAIPMHAIIREIAHYAFPKGLEA